LKSKIDQKIKSDALDISELKILLDRLRTDMVEEKSARELLFKQLNNVVIENRKENEL
jgi:hypothetical protein